MLITNASKIDYTVVISIDNLCYYRKGVWYVKYRLWFITKARLYDIHNNHIYALTLANNIFEYSGNRIWSIINNRRYNWWEILDNFERSSLRRSMLRQSLFNNNTHIV